jgi:protein phosphatase
MLRVADFFADSDTGRARRANEDAFFAHAPVFAVADGMGGAQAGEVASRTVVDCLRRGLPDGGSPEERLAALAEEANGLIHRKAAEDEERAGMGTTLTAAYVDEDAVSFGHVGDSRAYLFRDARLQQLTNDHSLVGEMVRRGKLTAEQAEEHPQRSIITRALGPEPEVEPDVHTEQARSGDVYLVCSDGLTTMLGEDRIEGLLVSSTNLEAAVRALVQEANRAGGRDNITAVAFRLEEVGAGAAEQDEHPTLIGPTADAEGLRGEEIRAGSARQRVRQPRRRGAVLRRVAIVLVSLLILGAVAFGAWYGNRQVWFLGTDDGGRVALYRGLPYDLPFGISLYSERYASPIQTDSLPTKRRDSVTQHELRSRSDAVSLIEDLQHSEGVQP